LHAGGHFDYSIVDFRPGIAVLQITGKDLSVFFNESGTHRWQRVPPTERYGRVQTSAITVAVLKEPSKQEFILRDQDLDIKTTRGSGNGGQNRNKTETCVVMIHLPTKTTVRIDGRSQYQNRETAKDVLRAMLYKKQQERLGAEQDAVRRSQIGSGMRGDKRRTVRVQHNIVKDHISGKEWLYEDYAAGKWK
jgi:peptide chain release factor 1